MKMWPGCLAAYNSGRLHGAWCDVSTDADENAATIAKVLASSPIKGAEEFYIADYDGPRSLADALGEYPSADALANAATLLEAIEGRWSDAGDIDAVLDVMLDGRRACDLADLAEGADEWISDRYAGEGETLQAWVAEFLDETGFFGALPKGDTRDVLERYFDFESYGRDMQLGGDIYTVRANGRLLVFWNR